MDIDKRNNLIYSSLKTIDIRKIDFQLKNGIENIYYFYYEPKCSDDDYAITYFYRYFARQFNRPENIFEIPAEDYDKENHSESLYKVIKLKWKISTNTNEINMHNKMVNDAITNNSVTTYKQLIDTTKDTYKKDYVKLLNYNTIVQKDKTFPGIKLFLGNRLIEFYKDLVYKI